LDKVTVVGKKRRKEKLPIICQNACTKTSYHRSEILRWIKDNPELLKPIAYQTDIYAAG